VLPAHAADIDEILSFMSRADLKQLNELLGRLRDGLHARANRNGSPAARRRQGSAAAGLTTAASKNESA
jgi:hypothetical protein